MSDSLRVLVMTSSSYVPVWQARCIQRLLDIEGVITSVSMGGPLSDTSRGGFVELLTNRLAAGAAQMRSVYLPGVFKTAPNSLFSPSVDLQRSRPDAILDFTGTLFQEVSWSPIFGIWTFRASRGHVFPPTLDILASNNSTFTCALTANNGNDRLQLLHTGTFAIVPHSYRETVEAILTGITWWPAKAARVLAAGGQQHFGTLLPGTALLDRPGLCSWAAFVMSLTIRTVRHRLRGLLYNDLWTVGIIAAKIDAVALTPGEHEVAWASCLPSQQFLADPFGIEGDGGATLLVEELSHLTGRGHISAMHVAIDGKATRPLTAIQSSIHMAYPYILTTEEAIYCIPDTGQAREVNLFRAIAFPHSWELDTVLLTDVAAVDSTIFHCNGFWWLFYTDRDMGPSNNLNAWYATSVRGPWQPHAGNPLKTDVRSSRPAGTPFFHAGSWYRPSQDCSRVYGGAIVINRILRLTPKNYDEEAVSRIENSEHSRFRHGIHTLSSAGQSTLVDAKRKTFIPEGSIRAASRVVHPFARLLRRPSDTP